MQSRREWLSSYLQCFRRKDSWISLSSAIARRSCKECNVWAPVQSFALQSLRTWVQCVSGVLLFFGKGAGPCKANPKVLRTSFTIPVLLLAKRVPRSPKELCTRKVKWICNVLCVQRKKGFATPIKVNMHLYYWLLQYITPISHFPSAFLGAASQTLLQCIFSYSPELRDEK